MYTHTRLLGIALMFATLVGLMASPIAAIAADRVEIDRDVDTALRKLLNSTPAAKTLASRAKAILVFPSIVKGGFIFGLQYGEGALRRRGRTEGYYSTVSASYGFQAGVQSFGYALFLMSDSALGYLNSTGGWEIGVGPSIVIADAGTARALTTTTARDDIYAFFFNQRGLMAGAGLQGTKISRIQPD
jgi:lipid-binding SYLF domain-containing protein